MYLLMTQNITDFEKKMYVHFTDILLIFSISWKLKSICYLLEYDTSLYCVVYELTQASHLNEIV